MNNRLLGLIAMTGAPFLLINVLINGCPTKIGYQPTSLSGIFNFVYITAWICSIAGLYRIKAAGNNLFGKTILIIQFILLLMESVWTINKIFNPIQASPFFDLLDLSWPLSNCFMLFTGTLIALEGKLTGFKRYVPLLAGMWFPLLQLPAIFLGFNESKIIIIGGIYSTIAWLLLGNTIKNTTDTISR